MLILGGALLFVMIVLAFGADLARLPEYQLQVYTKSSYLRLFPTAATSTTEVDLLEEPLRCSRLTIAGNSSISIDRSELASPSKCGGSSTGCTFTLPIQVAGKSLDDISISHLRAQAPRTIELSSSASAKSRLAVTSASTRSLITLRPGTRLTGGEADAQTKSWATIRVFTQSPLDLHLQDCESPLLPHLEINDFSTALESAVSGPKRKRLLEGEVRFADYKDRAFRVGSGGDIEPRGFRGHLVSLTIADGAIAAQLVGRSERILAGYGPQPIDRTPSLLSWIIEWHTSKGVLVVALAVFSTIMGAILWYWDRVRK